MYSLRIREDGMREPHWHPVTAELGYVHRGSGRMTVMDPDGSLDTYRLSEGDVYFQPMPGDIGYRASASAYSREVLAATFNLHIDDLPDFPFTKTDPLIVNRTNPVD